MNVHEYKPCILFNDNFRIYQIELEAKFFLTTVLLSLRCCIDVRTDTKYLDQKNHFMQDVIGDYDLYVILKK